MVRQVWFGFEGALLLCWTRVFLSWGRMQKRPDEVLIHWQKRRCSLCAVSGSGLQGLHGEYFLLVRRSADSASCASCGGRGEGWSRPLRTAVGRMSDGWAKDEYGARPSNLSSNV